MRQIGRKNIRVGIIGRQRFKNVAPIPYPEFRQTGDAPDIMFIPHFCYGLLKTAGNPIDGHPVDLRSGKADNGGENRVADVQRINIGMNISQIDGDSQSDLIRAGMMRCDTFSIKRH